MPVTHFSANSRAVEDSSAIEPSRLRAISGMRTLSSNWPCMPPIVIAVSLPITCAETCSTTSGITGLTLPGMIEEPFCSSGRKISPMPTRGPEPISARSLAILVSETAITFSAPESSTSASRLPCASKGPRARATSSPVSDDSVARTVSANCGCVFRPVPVAVPPSGICADVREGGLDTRAAEADLRGVAGELLAERDRDRVHQVRAAGLHEVLELLGLGRERLLERLQRGQQPVGRLVERGEVHGAREDVVGGLPHVHVVVRVRRRRRRASR